MSDSHSQPTNSLPRRKSPRAKFNDYSGGDYFVTICTSNKEHYLGRIKNGEMIASEIGMEAKKQLYEIPSHYSYAKILNEVVMPNHIHLIIRIEAIEDQKTKTPQKRSLLSVVIGGYKQSVTMFARRHNYEFEWQERYHDHIIRNQYDGRRLSDYIDNNIINWDKDCFFSSGII
ncbi:MAG: transposase [Muribaculaceae bacterium]|nr:transposase [Muribaculaceae bacterium]